MPTDSDSDLLTRDRLKGLRSKVTVTGRGRHRTPNQIALADRYNLMVTKMQRLLLTLSVRLSGCMRERIYRWFGNNDFSSQSAKTNRGACDHHICVHDDPHALGMCKVLGSRHKRRSSQGLGFDSGCMVERKCCVREQKEIVVSIQQMIDADIDAARRASLILNSSLTSLQSTLAGQDTAINRSLSTLVNDFAAFHDAVVDFVNRPAHTVAAAVDLPLTPRQRLAATLADLQRRQRQNSRHECSRRRHSTRYGRDFAAGIRAETFGNGRKTGRNIRRAAEDMPARFRCRNEDRPKLGRNFRTLEDVSPTSVGTFGEVRESQIARFHGWPRPWRTSNASERRFVTS